MNPADTLTATRTRVVTVTAVASGVSPMAFLRYAGAGPRGFWARGDRWVAHSGAAWTLEVVPGDSAERFSRIREFAEELLEPSQSNGGDSLRRARFYGGFSFRADHVASDPWTGFPPALFHLPEFELEGGRGRPTRLTARVGIDPEVADGDTALTILLARIHRLRKGLYLRGAEAAAEPKTVPTTRHESERDAWNAAVADALEAIEAGEVSKVVLARTLDVITETRLDPVEVVEHLWKENRGAHVFLFEPVDGCPMVGAAPETVATVRRREFHATAVAGTVARGETPEEQEILARRLLASEKDGAEHRIALDDMVARLKPMAEGVEAQPQPHVLTLARIQHLETEIRATLPEGASVLPVLEALHPTPAVCGLPRDAALEFLAREEPFERGWYAGPVGWFDVEGNGVFAPALRCAVALDRQWRLFAGAGIVAGSDPALEWEETRIKFEPVLRALAASGAK